MKLLLQIFNRYLSLETGKVEYIEEEGEEGGEEPPVQLGYPMTEQVQPLGFRRLNDYSEIDPEIR